MPANKLFLSLKNQKSFLDDVLIFLKELKRVKDINDPELFQKAINVFKNNEEFLLTVLNEIQLKRFENTLIDLLVVCRNKYKMGLHYKHLVYEYHILIVDSWKHKDNFFTKSYLKMMHNLSREVYFTDSFREYGNINRIKLFCNYLNTLD